MGQYYMPILIDSDGKITTLYSHDYDNGLKLTEHSWIGNDFVNAVVTQLWKNPQRVAWIGDYSDTQTGDAYEQKLKHAEFMLFYKAAWNKRDKYKVRPDSAELVKENGLDAIGNRCYLVNHTTKQFIDMVDYCEGSSYIPKWDGRFRWCIHPLPILTACGNDRGGGDFRAGSLGYDLVGTWAFDLIEMTNIQPVGYAPFCPVFKESDAV